MKKILSFFVALSMILNMSVPVFAAEQQSANESQEVMQIEVSKDNLRLLSEEEALNLGFSLEDIEGQNIYEVTTQVYPGSIPSVLYSGDIAYEDVVASNSFTGAGHTIYANKIKVGVNLQNDNINLWVGLYSYNSYWPNNQPMIYLTSQHGKLYQSDWRNIYYGDTYYFKYYLSSTNENYTLPVYFNIMVAVL